MQLKPFSTTKTILLSLVLLFNTSNAMRLVNGVSRILPGQTDHVPGFIKNIIEQYQNDDNNVFLVISPLNKNEFHGNIVSSSVNSNAGGKGNKQVAVTEINQKDKDVELRMIIKRISKVQKRIQKIVLTHRKIRSHRK